jgi:bifunctional non-homologous end joining protein LigD
VPNLAKYREKRNFSRTAEPRGTVKKTRARAAPSPAEALSFVVQKHAARRLHYDFRLELDGVLLSWAVPKGPSLVPGEKRLAVETEPHPLEYGTFEGTIAEGEYGAGHVELWDRGTWQPEGDPRRDYERGRLSFTLQGDKLRGGFHLVRTAGGAKDGKQWLLFKGRDAFARSEDERLTDVEPELATLVSAAPTGDDWVHELKFDGYRLLARVEGGSVKLLTRGGHDWTAKMPTIARAFAKLELDRALLDGEVVALDPRGVSDFQALQNSLNAGREAGLVYYAFDLLHLNGEDLRRRPLTERKAALARMLAAAPAPVRPTLRVSEHVVGGGPAFFRKACELGVEGIVSKRADAPYRSGRGRDWLKVKCTKRQEFVIVGFTDPGGSRSHFGALLLAVETEHGLRYAGRVGTGFTQESLAELHQRLAPLKRSTLSLEHAPRGADARGVHWVDPVLVAEVAFSSRTEDELLRHPTFLGLRDDKEAREVKRERPEDVPDVAHADHPAPRASAYPLSHPEKVLYPGQGITKRELLEYYASVAERMLPHVVNRPLTLVRCPDGVGKPCFFQKHPAKKVPEGIRSVNVREKDGKAPYSVIDDVQGLFGLVQLGALEIHTWGSHANDPEHPDLLVFDLDPDPSVPFSSVVTSAHELRKVFEAAKLESFVKTTGGKGLHVCLPIRPELTWDEAKDFSRRIAEDLARRSPERYVTTVSKAKRQGKIFIDYLRNARSATFVAPYSTRARENAPVALPLEWDELTEDLRPELLTLQTVPARLASGGKDPFARMATLAPSLKALLSDRG